MVQAAAIYARISNDPSGDRLGVTRQVADCEALAARLGWTIKDRDIDDDRSAWSGKPRPEYSRLLADIAHRAVDGVLAYNLDRLHRQPREFEAFLDTCDAARLTAVHTVQNDFNLGSSQGRAMARVMGTFARLSSDATSERVKRKNDERAAAGLPTGGGFRPFGYTEDRLRIDPIEAALIREAARRVLAGDSVRAIAIDWNERGILTPAGKPWKLDGLRRVLENPRISGQLVHRGEVVGPAAWEAILTPEQTAAIRATIDTHRRARWRPTRRYFLTGILSCGLCGSGLVARPTADGTRRYVCAKGVGFAGCGRLAINAEPVEAFVAEAILQRLDTPELASALADPADADAASAAERESLAEDEAQLDALARDHAERRITRHEWHAAREVIVARMDATRKRLSRLSRTAPIDPYVGRGSTLRAEWKGMDLNRQRAITSALLARAIVRPAVPGRATFDPARIEPVWRT